MTTFVKMVAGMGCVLSVAGAAFAGSDGSTSKNPLLLLLEAENTVVASVELEKSKEIKEVKPKLGFLARLSGKRSSPSMPKPDAELVKTNGIPPQKTFKEAEWRCLTEALYFEARGESLKGQIAVAEVILNRVASKRYPNSVCGVISQGAHRRNACQFSYKCDGKAEVYSEPKAHARLRELAHRMLTMGSDNITKGAVFYHHRGVSPRWSRSHKVARTTQIGVHYFYRFRG